jgi:hypothetical protein
VKSIRLSANLSGGDTVLCLHAEFHMSSCDGSLCICMRFEILVAMDVGHDAL